MAVKLPSDNDHEEFQGINDLNLTPLIDIMLVLLIIFMVTSSISLDSGLDIDLPKTSSTTQKESGNVVIVSLDSQGNISIQGQKADSSPELLKTQIAHALQQEKTDEVIFEGDTGSKLGRMIEIMDIAKNAGAQKFSIATESQPN